MPAATRRRRAKAAVDEIEEKDIEPQPDVVGTEPGALVEEQGMGAEAKAVPKGRGRRRAASKKTSVKSVEPAPEEAQSSVPAPVEDLEEPVPSEEEVRRELPEEIEAEVLAAPEPTPAEPSTPPEEGPETLETGFGWLIWDGERYDFDVVVHADRHVSRRQKALSRNKREKYGHTPLTRKELALMESEKPEMVIIGSGQYGNLPLTPKAERWLEGYQYFIGSTPEALKRLKSEERKAVAILHVTC